MPNNFLHMVFAIIIFLLLNFLTMLGLLYFREKKAQSVLAPSFMVHLFTQMNVLKLSFIFAASYFIIYIVFSHSFISCEKLDKDAKCQCYALEIIHQPSKQQKSELAQNALESCPTSDFFSQFIVNQTSSSLLTKLKKVNLAAIQFNNIHGVEVKEESASCKQLIDLPVDGEHFINVTDMTLSKGSHYFVFETKKLDIPLYIYMIGKNESLLFPWTKDDKLSNNWSASGESNGLKPLLSKIVTSPSSEKLIIVVQSMSDQTIELRWQHGNSSGTIYKGSAENTSQICNAQFG